MNNKMLSLKNCNQTNIDIYENFLVKILYEGRRERPTEPPNIVVCEDLVDGGYLTVGNDDKVDLTRKGRVAAGSTEHGYV